LEFLFAAVLFFEFESFDFLPESADFDALALFSFSLPAPAIFAPASTAPITAPEAAPFRTSVKTSVVLSTRLFAEAATFFLRYLP
jgi:hypothetical protein